jgi:hypothetical protein
MIGAFTSNIDILPSFFESKRFGNFIEGVG